MEFVQKEHGDAGVTAFAIHPGNVVTDIVGGEEGIRSINMEHGESLSAS